MTVEPEQNSRERVRQAGPPYPVNDGYQDEDSPDLLRWRADLLMDEMMLGAVDVSAGDSEIRSVFPEPDPSAESSRVVQLGEGESNSVGDRSYSQPMDGLSDPYNTGKWQPISSAQSGVRPDDPAYDTSLTDSLDVSSHTHGVHGRSDNGYVHHSAVPDTDDQESTVGSESQSNAVWSGEKGSEEMASASMQSERDRVEPETRPNKWDWQPPPLPRIESRGPSTEPIAYGNETKSSVSASTAALGRDSDDFVSAMTISFNGQRRSTLLPRMSSLDVDALNREIDDLHAEIAMILPIGHETAERARHLLDKAHTILQGDPMRSAEVEYYMQQVRSIVQRVRQTHRWSNLYRDRLRVYLGAWILLSLIVLLGRYLFQLQLEAVVSIVTNSAFDTALVQHSATLVGAVFAGSLGGAAGALLTMQRHMRQEYGFFDRKYGLRGLMLPIIGAVLGTVLYLGFGLVYSFVGLQPSLNVIVATVPALAAFGLGFSQESIYGIRD